MILKVLQIIKEYLKKELKDIDSITLSTISKDGEHCKEGGIIITLLNIQEESSVKSQIPLTTDGTKKKNPDVLLNLHILLSAQDEKYETALKNISSVISVFQANNVFTVALDDRKDSTEEFKLSLHSMTLEQNLSMWQTLGDKLMPSVIYKVSILRIQASEDVTSQSIERIGIGFEKYKSQDDTSSGQKKSSKDILGQSDDMVFSKNPDTNKSVILSAEERNKAHLPEEVIKDSNNKKYKERNL